jgi:DNA-binding transcriptional LysR family regulator
MTDEQIREFERWCRDTMPELARFYAACFFKNRRKAGGAVGREGLNVGRSIIHLEKLLGGVLQGGSLIDHKEPRKVHPTEAGEELLRYCEQMESMRLQLLQNLDRLQRGSEIRIAMTHSAWLAYFGALETAYKQRRPEGALNYGEKFFRQDKVWTEIEQEVLDGRADVGVYSFPPSRRREMHPDLAVQNWIREEIVLVLPESPDNPKGDTLSLNDLSILRKVVHYSRSLKFDRTDTIEKYLRQQGTLKRFAGKEWLLGVNSIAEMIQTLREQRSFMSFLPWPTVEQDHRCGALRAYRLNSPMRPRLMTIICRLHTDRRAVADFLKAAASLQGTRNFEPNSQGQNPRTRTGSNAARSLQ